MKKFLLRTLLFIIPVVLFTFLCDQIVTRLLQKSRHNNFAVWNDLLQGNVNSDIVIYGSSRAWVHINPKIIEDSLGTNAYNFGVDGHNFYMQYLRHQLLMKNNKIPKLIILSLDNVTLDKRIDLLQPEQFLPYFSDQQVLSAVKTYQGYDRYDYGLPYMRYIGQKKATNEALAILFSNAAPPDRYKGFAAHQLAWTNDFAMAVNKHRKYVQHLDSATIRLFDRFLDETLKQGIKLIFVYTPEYIEGQKFVSNREEIFSFYYNFSKKYSIPFYDYSNDSLCYDKKYFYNSQHLNATGADIFTKKLVPAIRAAYNENKF